MKKIILVLFFSIFFVSTVNAKTIIFKECTNDAKFDSKTFEKDEFIVDTKLNSAKRVYVYTEYGLVNETERRKKIEGISKHHPQKINVDNFTIEHVDNKYVKLKTQSSSANYSTLTLNLEKKTIERTLFFNGEASPSFLDLTCSGYSDSSSGVKDTLKKVIGK